MFVKICTWTVLDCSVEKIDKNGPLIKVTGKNLIHHGTFAARGATHIYTSGGVSQHATSYLQINFGNVKKYSNSLFPH